jgi:hypothetical protein
MVDAHQGSRLTIVRGGAESPAQRGAADEELKRDEDQHGRGQRQDRKPSDAHWPQPHARRLDAARVEASGVSRERFEQRVLDDDREPERHQHRREQSASEQPVESGALQQPAQPGHEGGDEDQRSQRVHPRGLHDDEGQERGQDAEISVGQVHQPHHAEDERKTGGEEGIESAQQDALHDGIDPGQRQTPK